MKQTINRKGNPGMLRVDGRPDRTKAPLIKPQDEVNPKAVTLTPLDPKQPYPTPEPSGVFTTQSYKNEVTVEASGYTKKGKSK